MKKNNKGFSIVELLGVMVILGILFSVAIGAVYIYREKAEKQSYDTMAKSASHAAENYAMEYSSETEVTLEKLMDLNLLERLADPKDETKTCSGKVKIELASAGSEDGETKTMDDYKYTVKLCCEQYKKEYIFPGEKTNDISDCS